MKLNLVPARTGAEWVRIGLKTFWRQPLAFISLFFLFMASISIASQLPLIGSVLAPILLPFMTLGLMVATSVAYTADRQKPAAPAKAPAAPAKATAPAAKKAAAPAKAAPAAKAPAAKKPAAKKK